MKSRPTTRWFLLMSALATLPLSALDLVKESKPHARIYLSADEEKALQQVLEDFNTHLEKMSGTKLEIIPVEDPAKVQRPALVVGSLAGKLGAAPKATQWKEGYRIRVTDKDALVAGETPQATSYGLYSLLYALGCDWVMPGPLGEIIPEKKTITLPKGDQASSPDFGHRRFWYRGGPNLVSKEEREEYNQWTRRQRLGIGPDFVNDREGHIWDQIIRKYKTEFDADPTMLALVRQPDGQLVRKGPQFETTHPRVLELVIQDIRDQFEAKKWPKDQRVTLGIGPADGDGYSLSAETLSLSPQRQDAMMGGIDSTDIVVEFANRVLEKIGDEYPNLSLGFYVYGVHADFPVMHKPHPRIYPIFAPISFSRIHSTEDPHSKTRHFYREVLDQWSALAKEQGNRFMVYEYNWNLADNMLPYSKTQMLAEDIAMYHKLGFSGFILESTKAWSINGAADYVAARLVWDASQDWKKLLNEYCTKSFGAAAPMMESYYGRLIETQNKSGQEAGSYYSAPLIFDAEYLKAAKADLDKALAQKLSEPELARVKAAVYPHSVLVRYLAWHDALGKFDFAKAKQEYDGIISDWQVQVDANGQFVAREVPNYMKGLMNGTTEAGLKYSTAPYQVIHQLPNALKTAFDPTGRGEQMGLALPDINDSKWVKTETFDSTWDAQGLGYYRDGTVWYRETFEVPKTLDGKAIGLFLGGFEDEALVWLNGQPLGRSGIKFVNPAIFDLTPAIKYGEKNVLAIQIIRQVKINEMLLGGLLRPSYIFTGPKVEVSEKRGEPEYRVLPGGEKEKIQK